MQLEKRQQKISRQDGIQYIASIFQGQSWTLWGVEKYSWRDCQIKPFYKHCLRVHFKEIAISVLRKLIARKVCSCFGCSITGCRCWRGVKSCTIDMYTAFSTVLSPVYNRKLFKQVSLKKLLPTIKETLWMKLFSLIKIKSYRKA